MKRWMKYEDYLMRGEWHIHTNYTDGKNSVREYCKKAAKLGLHLIAFTEHVRRDLTYNFDDFAKEIENARKEYRDLIILTGCEAKVLEEGRLDVSEKVIEECDVVLMAFHSFPNSKRKYVTALREALCDPRVDVWAHPGLSPINAHANQNHLKLSDEEFIKALDIAKRNDVLIEINRKYKLPPRRLMNTAEKHGVKFVRGSDVHRVRDLK
jgi:DNA polymerase (family 10)/putative hydrolase